MTRPGFMDGYSLVSYAQRRNDRKAKHSKALPSGLGPKWPQEGGKMDTTKSPHTNIYYNTM